MESVSSGLTWWSLECKVRYDLRKPSEELQRCSFAGRAPTSMDISFGDADLAFGFGSNVSVFRGADVFRSGKAPSTYLKNNYSGQQVGNAPASHWYGHRRCLVSDSSRMKICCLWAPVVASTLCWYRALVTHSSTPMWLILSRLLSSAARLR